MVALLVGKGVEGAVTAIYGTWLTNGYVFGPYIGPLALRSILGLTD